ncbi:EF-P beta-lysylation protein EpmB [Agaribacterium haliotis]|uniref:EF-P beta-lysylation protein EpmB n=1 Tax=Agaribacterium haliotis TaxID=2013869 RepID=UPI000BB53909|nr:EF-P beta-lysylation protein EpmB [Agaribacterium haliotis]
MNAIPQIQLHPGTSWQDELKQLVSDSNELFELLELDRSYLPAAKQAEKLFPLRLTRSYLSRIKKGDINDPLLKQVLPLAEENEAQANYVDDPLQERAFNPLPGLVHKYHNRVLLITTSSCAINCRYCFRRNFAYSENRLGQSQWQAILDYLKDHDEVDEVIFSGGEPLLLTNEQIQQRLEQLAAIPQLHRVRFHSRLPIVLPSRIDQNFCATLNSTRLQCLVVVHCNHKQEIDAYVAAAFSALSRAGITCLNQAVLLRGVNDSAKSQIELNHSLFKNKVLPYYLHVLDKVRGGAHFDIELSDARIIYEKMRARLPGYLLPKLVKDEPGQTAKTPL